MLIKQANAGPLTNFEVLDFLRSRGITTDALGTIGVVSPSECKVYDYLVQSAACNQTRESINEFLKRCEKFDLAKAEKLNLINLRPSSQPEMYAILEAIDKRMVINEEQGIDQVQELLDLVNEVLPPPPVNPEEAQGEVKDGTLN